MDMKRAKKDDDRTIFFSRRENPVVIFGEPLSDDGMYFYRHSANNIIFLLSLLILSICLLMSETIF